MPSITPQKMSRNSLADVTNAYERDGVIVSGGDKCFRVLRHAAFLTEIVAAVLDSDMAMREEDEGEVSPLLNRLREALDLPPKKMGE